MQKNYTRNVAAYQLYLEGRFHLQHATPPELVSGIDSFQRALKVDPDYALAYVGLAESYRRQAIISDADPQIVLPLARTAALQALRIDDTLAEAYVPLGFVHFWYDWQWPAAETAFKRGIELQPNFADLHFGYAALLSNLGRNDEALRESQRARELDPTSPLYVALEASFVAYAGHTDEARQQIEGVLRAHPDFWIAHLARGWLDTNAGRYADAVDDFSRASKLSGGSQQALSMLGFALARAHRKTEAQALLDTLLQHSRQRYLPPTSIATIYCGLGDNDQALDWLERGYAAHDVRMTFLKVDRRWDSLRSDPRFTALMRKMQLPAD
jgi:tetratricopeptide (TPR) repeat protein